jgi:hypothetical protein
MGGRGGAVPDPSMPASVPAKSFKIALHKGTKTLPTHLHLSINSKWMDVRPPPDPLVRHLLTAVARRRRLTR